jgi:hypothetical protein
MTGTSTGSVPGVIEPKSTDPEGNELCVPEALGTGIEAIALAVDPV